MGNSEYFKSIEEEYPNLSEGKIVKLVSANKIDLDEKQIINWVFRMIPAIQNMMSKNPNPIALVLAAAGVFNVLKTVSNQINVQLVVQLNDSIQDNIDMAEKYPQTYDKEMVRVNVSVKNRMHRLKKLGDNREQMEYLVSLFLFLRSLKTIKKASQELQDSVDYNLKELKKMITEKRVNMIQKKESTMHGVVKYYDFFYGSTVFTAPQVSQSGGFPYPKKYIGNIESTYKEFMKIK